MLWNLAQSAPSLPFPSQWGAVLRSAFLPLHGALIITGRLIDTPREAARFVSLLACEKIAGVGSGKVEQWADPHTFLCSVGTPPALSPACLHVASLEP